MKTAGRKRRSEATWRELFSRQTASGMTASEFCRREGINKNVFHRWRVALLGSGVRAAVTPVAVRAEPTSFIDLGALSQPASRWEVRLDMGNGVVLSLARS
jgi:transposase-like protein